MELRFIEDVQCFVSELRYDYTTKTGTLVLGRNSATDMSGCIALFKRIDPEVTDILTLEGKKPDTSYHLIGGKWQARHNSR